MTNDELAGQKAAFDLRDLEETSYWLELMADSESRPAGKLSRLRDEANQLIAIFVTILVRTKKPVA